MVGRSLPLELLCLWVKYRERRSADYGEEGFRDTRLAVGVGLSSCEKVYELYVCRASNPQMAQAGVRRRHEDSRAGPSASRGGFAGRHESSAGLGVP